MKKHKTLSDKIDKINEKAQMKVDNLLRKKMMMIRDLEINKCMNDVYIKLVYIKLEKYAGKRFSYDKLYGIYTFSFEGRLQEYSASVFSRGDDGLYKFSTLVDGNNVELVITIESLEKELMKWLKMIAKNEGVNK